MHDTVKKALMLAKNRRKYASGGVPDDDSQEAFLQEQLQGSAPQYEPAAENLVQSATTMTTPGAIADAAGYMGGPSALQNLKDQNYLDAALQLAAVVPGVGPLKTASKASREAQKLANAEHFIEWVDPSMKAGRRYKTEKQAIKSKPSEAKLVHTTIEDPVRYNNPIKKADGGDVDDDIKVDNQKKSKEPRNSETIDPIIQRGMTAVKRAKSQDGGSKMMINRKMYEPIRGLKIKQPPEELSDEPDIRSYQLKRHSHEFIGSPEPEAPKRSVYLDAPLFGVRKKLFDMPYYYQPAVQKALNFAYGQKTTPFYLFEPTAPLARAIDAYETAKFIQRDPKSFSSYTGVPGTLMGITKMGVPAVASGAYLAGDGPADQGPTTKTLPDFDFGETFNVISHPKSAPEIKKEEDFMKYAKGGGVDDEFHALMAEADDLLEKFKE